MTSHSLRVPAQGTTLLASVFAVLLAALSTFAFTVPAEAGEARPEPEPEVVQSYQLRHADIRDVMTTVRSLAGAKHVAADELRNVLTVRDTAERVQRIDELVARIDLRPSETLIRLELVAIDPRTSDPHGTEGAPADRDEVRKRLRENLGAPGNAGQPILNANASIVGDGEAAVRVERSPLGDSTYVDLMVKMSSRARGDEILLGLEIDSAVLRRGDENTRAATQSTWSSRSGQPLFIHLPLSVELDGAPKTLALRVTPKVVTPGEAPPAKALWLGTETGLPVPSDTTE